MLKLTDKCKKLSYGSISVLFLKSLSLKGLIRQPYFIFYLPADRRPRGSLERMRF